jgi:hypothetical protein
MRAMDRAHSSQVIKNWPDESREAAELVIEQYGEPHEATHSMLIWHNVGPWKRMVASRAFYDHHFPAPHIDAVESFIDYRVPVEMFGPWPSSTAASSSSGRPVRSRPDATTSRRTSSP